MTKTYRPWNPNQQYLLPPSVKDRLPENDLVYFVLDTVNELDISAITNKYEQENRLKEEIHQLLSKAQATDEREDQKYGVDRRGDELPEELARRQSRLKHIQEAKKALEAEAKAAAQQAQRKHQGRFGR